MPKNKVPVSVQLWSVRNEVAADLSGTLAKLAGMGYVGVETAGLGKTSTSEWTRILKDNGLAVSGAHIGLDSVMGTTLTETLEMYGEIGCRRFTIPSLARCYTESLDGYRRACTALNTAADRVKALGCTVGYHNHDFEFKFVENRIPFALMLDFLTSDVEIQLDVGWVYKAGCDGAAYVRSLPGRSKTIHVKAFKPGEESAVVGEDSVPWVDVFAACETVGSTEWYVVEHENYEVHTPMQCVEKCIDNLRAMGKV